MSDTGWLKRLNFWILEQFNVWTWSIQQYFGTYRRVTVLKAWIWATHGCQYCEISAHFNKLRGKKKTYWRTTFKWAPIYWWLQEAPTLASIFLIVLSNFFEALVRSQYHNNPHHRRLWWLNANRNPRTPSQRWQTVSTDVPTFSKGFRAPMHSKVSISIRTGRMVVFQWSWDQPWMDPTRALGKSGTVSSQLSSWRDLVKTLGICSCYIVADSTKSKLTKGLVTTEDSDQNLLGAERALTNLSTYKGVSMRNNVVGNCAPIKQVHSESSLDEESNLWLVNCVRLRGLSRDFSIDVALQLEAVRNAQAGLLAFFVDQWR